jgi:hypothetical protein
MTRAADFAAMKVNANADLTDLTPTPLTAAGDGGWQRNTSKEGPCWVDIALSAGTATFVVEVTNDPLSTNGTPIYGTADSPVAIAGTLAVDGFTLYTGAFWVRIRRVDSAGGNLTATLGRA